MLRRLCVLLIGVVLTGFAFLLVTGRYVNDGEVVARVTSEHGVHIGDLFVIGGWVAAMTALVVLASRLRSP